MARDGRGALVSCVSRLRPSRSGALTLLNLKKKETARSLPERRRHGFPWVHPSNAAFSTRFPKAKKGLENMQELETHEKRERGIMGTSVERERGVMGNHHSFRARFP